MELYHHSQKSNYRSPFGACKAGAEVRLRLDAAEQFLFAWVRAWFEGHEILTEMTRRGGAFEADILLPDHPGLYWYYFIAEDEAGRRLLYGNNPENLGGEGRASHQEPPSFQITLYDPEYSTPAWMHNGALYQIFPDRFCSSGKKASSRLASGCWYHENWYDAPEMRLEGADCAATDFFGGDLKGITQKLPYIASLGIGVIYLNPIFRARSNHKYDTGCYKEIDPSFGTMEDLQQLCAEAKEYGIRVMLDGVFSHTGSDSLYFDKNRTYGGNGAYCRLDSPFASWYRFKNWPEEYECWWDFPTLPNVNENDPAYRSYILEDEDSVVAGYLKKGVSGWRLDVADELPMGFLRALRRRARQVNPEAGVIGEVWEDASRKEAYEEMRTYCAGDTLDGCMNYPLRDALLRFLLGKEDGERFVRAMESQRENYPIPFLYACMNLLGSHDKPRAISVLSGKEGLEGPREQRRAEALSPEEYALGKARYLAAVRFLCAMPGMPSIYYGDEAGLTGMADPFCRGTFPWGREDVDLQRAVGEALRGRLAIFRTGYCALFSPTPDVIVSARFTESGLDAFGQPVTGPQMALCACNRSEQPVVFDLLPGDIEGFPMTRPVRLHVGACRAETFLPQ